MYQFTWTPHEKELWGALWWRKGQVRWQLLLPRPLQSTHRLAAQPALSPVIWFPLSPTEEFGRWPVLSSLPWFLSPMKQTPALGWTATILIWPYQVIKCHFLNILSFPSAYLAWKWSIFHPEKRHFFGKLTSRVNPLDYCNQVFL